MEKAKAGKMKSKQIRVGEDFFKFKCTFEKNLNKALPDRNFTDPELTNVMATMFGRYKVVKIGKNKISYI